MKDLFDVQHYPQGEPPYDVAGWTLPLLLGVRRVEVFNIDQVKMHVVGKVDDAAQGLVGDTRTNDMSSAAFSCRDSDAWAAVFGGLKSGRAYSFDTKTGVAGLFVGYAKPDADRDPSEPVVIQKMPRIGLYSPWSGNMDEGWTRWVFDAYGVAYVPVRNEMLRAGALDGFLDVLVLPGVGANELDKGRADGSVPDEFTGGLDPEGAIAVEEFVRGGGDLVAIGSSTKWAIDLMKIPLVDVAAVTDAKEFSCPGSVLRTIPQVTTTPGTAALTTDLDDSVAIFFSRGQAFREMTDKERADTGSDKRKIDFLLRYAPTRLLLSGWIQKPETIADRGAWVRTTHGKGVVHLFGFRPQYRGWSQSAFQLLFRAMLFDARGVTKS